MPVDQDTSCPFCGTRIESGASACPVCDLPLIGENGEHPPARRSAPFDGAELFDQAFSDDATAEGAFAPLSRGRHAPHPVGRGYEPADGPMRCVVVAINEAEADMLSDMLRAEGVPCLVRPSGLQSYAQSSVRCEVLVPQAQLPIARELLRVEEPAAEASEISPHLFTLGVMFLLFAAAAAVALLIALAS